MKFTVADLLDQLTPETPVPVAQLEKALGLSDDAEQRFLRIGLDGLARLGLIEESEAGVQRRPDEGLIEARLRCSSKGFCFALREDGGEDVYIRDHQLNHAWNGDRVLVRITREGGRRRSPEGSVQCILERATSSLLAQVEQQNERLLAVPLDDRLLTSLELPGSDAEHLDPSQSSVVEVKVDRYPVGQFAPQGHVARRLAIHGGEEADLDLLLTKHGLREPAAPPRATLRTPAPKDREDLTGQVSFLLEGWSSQAPGLPALALESREENGGWRLWVHAPCVAERLALASPLDVWLRDQGEALCVGRSWLPLLTPALAKAAALQPGRTEVALSVALELTANGELEHYRFCRSTIRPAARVDLATLTALAERKPKARTVPAALKAVKDHLPLLESLVGLTERLRERRLAGGSLDLALPMPAIESLGDLLTPAPDGALNGWMVQLPAHHPMAILREAILLAHRTLGAHLAALQLPALYAVNPAPEAAELNEVAKAALALEIPLELSPEGNASAAELAAAFAATDRSRVLQQQLRNTLQPVQISAEPGAHAAAGEETAVAPWCCPSLHYADLWNQQLLTSLLVDGKDRPTVRHKVTVDLASDACRAATIDWSLLTPSQLAPFQEGIAHGLPQRLTTRMRFLQEVQADALTMAQARQAEPLVGQVLPGVISGVQSYGFFVEVPPSQVEGLVHVSSLKDDWYEYRARQNRLVGRKNRRTYMLGDAVAVEIQKVDALRHQIDLAVVLPDEELEAAGTEPQGDGPDAEEALHADLPEAEGEA